ncbi:tetratricopeptide repeat protein [Pasteurella atlantica]|uniref:tetratricopeptide repeat protein n=1 Tax=Phocoenobacter atlanticus TaxID=3416742 RepID=UPI002766279D|nr:tetratricopeptide repeat protein [Pasteurella atlantica]MDP8160421.1 tetratricopeptide repeat protein [Pasteurella atlantica]
MKKLTLVVTTLTMLFSSFCYSQNSTELKSNEFMAILELVQQNNTKAQFDLGNIYLNGKEGIKKSYRQAFQWFQKVAVKNDSYTPYAQFNLALMYLNGMGVNQSDKQAVTWFQAAAEKGIAQAQFNLARMYYMGQGITKSNIQAVKWYTKAAEQGMPQAQASLGIMYSKGEGVEKSYAKSIE